MRRLPEPLGGRFTLGDGSSDAGGDPRERLAAGSTPEEVRGYFVDKYGDWVLLAPPARGFGLLVWVLPFAGLAVGLLLLGRVLRRWTRRAAGVGESTEAPPSLDPADRARVRAALDDLRD
jgi:cytochrome c-type biogenesis protein CcmH